LELRDARANLTNLNDNIADINALIKGLEATKPAGWKAKVECLEREKQLLLLQLPHLQETCNILLRFQQGAQSCCWNTPTLPLALASWLKGQVACLPR